MGRSGLVGPFLFRGMKTFWDQLVVVVAVVKVSKPPNCTLK